MTAEQPPVTAFKAPLYIAWEITHRCNAQCLHCYSASGPKVDCSEELTTAEALSVIDQLADVGLLVLAFSGGEPLMRKDWSVLVAHAVAVQQIETAGDSFRIVDHRRLGALVGSPILEE